MKKSILVVALVVLVVALTAAVVRQRQQVSHLREQLASAAAAKTQPPPVAAPEQVAAEPAAESSPAELVAPPTSAPTSTPSPPAQVSSGTTNNFFAGLAGMMKDPQMKEMMRAQQKMMLDQMYGSLFKDLNRPANEMEALKDLLVDRQMALTEAGLSMMSGSGADAKQAAEDAKTVKADYDKKIQDMLGAQDYEVFHQYEETAAERMQIQMFKNALPADATLTEQQESDLIAAMSEERKAMPASSLLNTQTPDPSQLTEAHIAELQKQLEELQQRYADRAAAILTPAQLEQFTRFEKQMSAMQAASLKMAAQMFGQNKPNLAPQPNRNPTP